MTTAKRERRHERPQAAERCTVHPGAGQTTRGAALAFAADDAEDLDRLDALFRAIEWEANAEEGVGG